MTRRTSDPVSPDLFTSGLSWWVSGVTVVTTTDGHGQPHGFTASAFSAVSLRPPLVLVCLDVRANCAAAFGAAGWLAVHLLRSDQRELAERFASKGADKFADGVVGTGLGGVPLVPALARLECRITDRTVAGDHLILLAEVHRTDEDGGVPLVYYRRAFHTLAQLSAPA